MNDTQEDYLSMFNVVIERCEENIALISPIPMLLQTLADFKAKVQEIKDTAMEQGTVLTGIAEDKRNLKRNLAYSSNITAKIVSGYASTQENLILKAEVDYSEYELFTMRDEIIYAHCQKIHDRAQEHILALADCGLTPQIIADMQQAITDFEDFSAEPTLALNKRKIATETLITLFVETKQLLRERMDTNMSLFKLTNMHFYRLYKVSRKLRKSGGRKRKKKEVVVVVSDEVK
jgi:hypothetical protein